MLYISHSMSHLKYLFGLLWILVAVAASAQDDDKPVPYKRPESSYSRDTVSTNPKRYSSLEPKKKFDIGKMLIEPNLQLYFQSNYYQFGLMPSVGYNVWKGLYVGGSLNYNITYIPNYYSNFSGNVQVYGGGPFVHYKIWRGVFARLRFEMLGVRYPKYNIIVNNDIPYDNRGVPYVWLGAGYNLTSSRNFFIPLAIYVNPLYAAYGGDVKDLTRKTPYTSWFYVQIAFYIISPSGR